MWYHHRVREKHEVLVDLSKWDDYNEYVLFVHKLSSRQYFSRIHPFDECSLSFAAIARLSLVIPTRPPAHDFPLWCNTSHQNLMAPYSRPAFSNGAKSCVNNENFWQMKHSSHVPQLLSTTAAVMTANCFVNCRFVVFRFRVQVRAFISDYCDIHRTHKTCTHFSDGM